jgi:hypothetical protein
MRSRLPWGDKGLVEAVRVNGVKGHDGNEAKRNEWSGANGVNLNG